MDRLSSEHPKRFHEIVLRSFKPSWQTVLLVGILVLAMVVRVVGITENPPGFFTDEAAIGYNAYTILHSGKDEYGEAWPVLFKSFGDYKMPVFIYTTVLYVATFGLTELAIRLASASYGVLTVLTTFLLASALFKRTSIGLAAALFLAVMPWHIHYSRTGFGELVSFPPVLTLGLYLFLMGVHRNRLWPWAGLVLGLSLYTYRSAWVVLPQLLALIVVTYRRDLERGWRWALPAAGLIGLLTLPIILHLTSGTGDRSLQAGITRLDLGIWDTAKQFADQYMAHFSLSFLFERGDDGFILRHYLPGFGLLYWVQLPLLAFGALALVLNPRRENLIVILLLLSYPLAGALSDMSPISSRSILGSVVFAIISAYGLMLLVDGLGKLNRPYGPIAAGTALAVVLLWTSASFVSYLHLYHTQYQKLSAGYWGWQAGPKEIIEYYLTVENRYDQLVMDGEFNAPHMFFSFYAPERCGDCVIGNTDLYDPGKKQLFALKPKHYPAKYDYRTVHEIRYPDGKLAFSLAEIKGPRR